MALIHHILFYLNQDDGFLIRPQLMLLLFGIGILLTDYFMEPGLKYVNALMAGRSPLQRYHALPD
jgi:hypothetical protein